MFEVPAFVGTTVGELRGVSLWNEHRHPHPTSPAMRRGLGYFLNLDSKPRGLLGCRTRWASAGLRV